MTADELREHADMLLSAIPLVPPSHRGSLTAAADYLRACADAMDAGPVAWRYKPMFGSPWSLSDDGYYISCKRDQGYIAEKLYPLAMPAVRLPEPMTGEEIYASDDLMRLNGRKLGLSLNELAEVVGTIEAEVLRRVKETNK
ncbi:MAG: hypothetical protein WC121_11975 [Candidatus Kapaibacterium sp.]